MKYKKPAGILALSLSLLPLGAQIDVSSGRSIVTVNTANMEPRVVQAIDGVSTMYYSNNAPPVNGSPYLNEEFTEGTMTILDGTVVPGLRYRYDIYADRMQFIVNGDTAYINKPLALKSITLDNAKFVYNVYMVEADRVATGYFEVISEKEHMTFLLRRTIEIEQDIYVSNYGGGGGTKEFMMKHLENYYVKLGEGAAQEISSRKSFLDLVPGYQDQVKKYIKQNRLSVRRAEDLQVIAEYYENLLEADS